MRMALVLVLGVLFAGLNGYAQQTASTVDKEKLERLRKMSPEDRKKLLERLEQIKKLPEEERKRLLENLKKLKELPAEDQKRLREKVQQFTPQERDALAELAKGFFKDFHRRGILEGFPRMIFFTWIKNERPRDLEKIREMEAADRKEAFIRLYFEFKELALKRTREHVKKHKCVSPADVEALDDLSTPEYWPAWQKIFKSCQEKSKANKPPRENVPKRDRK